MEWYGKEKTKHWLILNLFPPLKISLLRHMLKKSIHSFFDAWSFLQVHIWFTPSEGPKDFVNQFLKKLDHESHTMKLGHGKGHLTWSNFMVHGVKWARERERERDLSFIQHKSPKIVYNLNIMFLGSCEMNRQQTCRELSSHGGQMRRGTLENNRFLSPTSFTLNYPIRVDEKSRWKQLMWLTLILQSRWDKCGGPRPWVFP